MTSELRLPSLRTENGPVKTLEEWKEFARRDDCLDRMVPSDLRAILSNLSSTESESPFILPYGTLSPIKK